MASCFTELAYLLIWTFLGPLAVGYIPLFFTGQSTEILKMASVFGSGLLVATVVDAIIPEAYSLLLIPEEHDHDNHMNESKKSGAYGGNAASFGGLATVLGFLFMFLAERISEIYGSTGSDSVPRCSRSHSHSHSLPHSRPSIHDPAKTDPSHSNSQQVYLELGPQIRDSPKLRPIPDNKFQKMNHSDTKAQNVGHKETCESPGKDVLGVNYLSFGLILHAAVDGIPLGAVACAGNHSVETVLVLSIILHKIPASFGLTTFLVGQGMPKHIVLRTLIAFCLAAPVSATFMAVLISWGTTNNGVAASSTGLGLLFSAGSMMHTISSHVLPEVSSTNADLSQLTVETCVFVLGIMGPFAMKSILGGDHHHDH